MHSKILFVVEPLLSQLSKSISYPVCWTILLFFLGIEFIAFCHLSLPLHLHGRKSIFLGRGNPYMPLSRIFLRMHISPFLWKWRSLLFLLTCVSLIEFLCWYPFPLSERMVLRFQKILEDSLWFCSLWGQRHLFDSWGKEFIPIFLELFALLLFCVFPSLSTDFHFTPTNPRDNLPFIFRETFFLTVNSRVKVNSGETDTSCVRQLSIFSCPLKTFESSRIWKISAQKDSEQKKESVSTALTRKILIHNPQERGEFILPLKGSFQRTFRDSLESAFFKVFSLNSYTKASEEYLSNSFLSFFSLLSSTMRYNLL